jgi:hypothetical protein
LIIKMGFEPGGNVSLDEVESGCHVEYHPVGGAAGTATSTGIVKRIITSPEPVGGRQTVQANEDEPRLVIENDNTHVETAYKIQNIVKVLDK